MIYIYIYSLMYGRAVTLRALNRLGKGTNRQVKITSRLEPKADGLALPYIFQIAPICNNRSLFVAACWHRCDVVWVLASLRCRVRVDFVVSIVAMSCGCWRRFVVVRCLWWMASLGCRVSLGLDARSCWSLHRCDIQGLPASLRCPFWGIDIVWMS